MLIKHFVQMQSDVMAVQFDGSSQANSQMHEGSFPYFDVSSQLDAGKDW